MTLGTRSVLREAGGLPAWSMLGSLRSTKYDLCLVGLGSHLRSSDEVRHIRSDGPLRPVASPILEQLLQLQEPEDQPLRPRRTAGDVDVDRHDPVDPLDRGVAPLITPTRAGAVTQGDAPLRLRHLLPESDERARH